jgi:hypothetical protein
MCKFFDNNLNYKYLRYIQIINGLNLERITACYINNKQISPNRNKFRYLETILGKLSFSLSLKP